MKSSTHYSRAHHNELVAKWRGGRAKLWDYSPTHSTLTLRVERRGVRGNLHIICGGCHHVCGPFSWEMVALDILCNNETPGEEEYVVRDKNAGFELCCQVISLIEDVEPVYCYG